jgi:putative oxygen-independent coproporphyrinogen III oxidase
MVDAIIGEIDQRKDELKGETVDTIYFGGGTPSLLKTTNSKRLLNEVFRNFKVSANPEITWEANPEDISKGSLNSWGTIGINRLSIGVQSFHESDLKWMNRVHSADQSSTAIALAVDEGFDNINIDLIYGLPKMTFEQWQFNVESMLQSGVNHLSAYNLTVEGNTLLHHQVKTGKLKLPAEDQAIKEVEWLESRLNSEGWERYEISNFCKNGNYAVHNTNYWKGANYLGLGPSAHSFFGNRRTWNIKNNHNYIKLIESGELSFETELLNKVDQVNEAIMLGLRTKWGVDLHKLNLLANLDYSDLHKKTINDLLSKSWITLDQNWVTLTQSGKLFADHIASELFWSE